MVKVPIMRTSAIFANLLLLGLAIYRLTRNVDFRDGEGAMMVAIFAAILSSLIALLTHPEGHGWLSLMLRRKALEEQRRIEELEKNH